jgi:protocatechuate 3,4-dioxygenase beta subunit
MARLLMAMAAGVWLVGAVQLPSIRPVTVYVVDADSGLPLPEAVVHFISEEQEWELETDEAGRAIFPEMSPGLIRLRIEKDGYIDPQDPEQSGRSYPAPAAARPVVIIPLLRAAVIAGEVTDAEGEPLGGMMAMALRRLSPESPRLTRTGAFAVTDDQGRYRLHGLPPGEYTVAVAPWGGGVAVHRAAGMQYLPGEADPSRAQFVELEGGQEIPSAHIRVAHRGMGSITGHVDGAAPGEQVHLAVLPATGFRQPIATAAAGADGQFRFESIPEGTFRLIAWSGSEAGELSRAPEGVAVRYGFTPVAVAGEGVAEVRMDLGPALRLRVRGECGIAGALRLHMEGGWPESWKFEGRPAGGGFEWESLPPGRYRVDAPALDPACVWLGVRRAGRQEAPAAVFDLTTAADLEAVTAPASAIVTGRLHLEGRPVAAAEVALWHEDGRTLSLTTATDAEGRFRFAGLPPGRYRLALLTDAVGGARPVIVRANGDAVNVDWDLSEKVQ